MKLIVFTLAFAVLFFCESKASTPLTDAVVSKQITAAFASTGSHSGKCVNINLTNKTSATLEIAIDAGTYLQHQDSTCQSHVITEQLMVQLQPRAAKTIAVNAMCVEKNKRCPAENSTFAIANRTSDAMKALCQIISKNKNQGYTDQNAMWCLQSRLDPNEYIEGDDSAQVMMYRKEVCKVLRLPLQPYKVQQYVRKMPVIESELSISAQGNWVLYDIKIHDSISTALYNEAGQVVSSITHTDVKETYGTITKNKYKIAYTHSAEGLDPTKKYYLRIKVNGVVQKQYCYEAAS